jgi:putative ABC transport system permease protein
MTMLHHTWTEYLKSKMAVCMNGSNVILKYGLRLVRREWRRFVLPMLSLGITAIVLSSTLLLTAASQTLLAEQARTLQGGDVLLESTGPIALVNVLSQVQITPERVTVVVEFSSSLQSDKAATAVSLQVVDAAYPLYGQIGVQNDMYRYPSDSEILLDAKAAERLEVTVGEAIQMGEGSFTVAGIIETDPTSLFSSFRFLPRALMSKEAFARANIDSTLLRAEYEYALAVPGLSGEQISTLEALEVESNGFIQTRIAGQGRGGLQAGLGIVTDFLVVAVLITAILAAVNVYASTLYFITAERKSFAILLSLGLTRVRLVGVIASALGVVVLSASILGVLIGYGVFLATTGFISKSLAIVLPTPSLLLYGGLTLGLIVALAISAFVPTIHTVLGLNPKQLLIGEERSMAGNGWFRMAVITLCTFLPILALSVFLLESWWRGIVVVGAVTGVYATIVGLFSVLLLGLYRIRNRFSFMTRSIIAQKRADGLFGAVSFTSLFVALTVLSTLVLLQSTLEQYLTQDLSTTVPTSYVIDIQPSQKEILSEQFPELSLFSNTPARIIAIDEVAIQEGIAAGNPEIDRELGREFNLTARDALLESEELVAGEWHAGRPGEISVDQDFATRANIELGSRLVFGIQGFEVSGVVTSIRVTDSRSGLPFFYFVLAPEDLQSFPSIYFGYAYHGPERQQELTRFLASDMPNVTVVETTALAPLLLALTELLLLIVFVVTIPPLLIAVLLIVTMIISSYTKRRREGGRLRSLGATKGFVTKWYLSETIALTTLGAVLAYVIGAIATYFISTTFLQVDTVVWFDSLLLSGVAAIILLTAIVGFTLVKSDTMPLRELLSYAE